MRNLRELFPWPGTSMILWLFMIGYCWFALSNSNAAGFAKTPDVPRVFAIASLLQALLTDLLVFWLVRTQRSGRGAILGMAAALAFFAVVAVCGISSGWLGLESMKRFLGGTLLILIYAFPISLLMTLIGGAATGAARAKSLRTP